MTIVDGVTFPPGQWIPDLAVLNDMGTDLLAVAVAALDSFGFGVRYERRFVGHGAEAAIEPSKASQLTVVLARMFLGKSGGEQFSPPEGAPGKYGFATADYEIEVTNPYPKRQGVSPVKTPDIASHRANLWRDSYVVWATMVAVALGGVIPPPGALRSAQDKRNGVLVGPMTPKGPAGGEASMVMAVSVQL